MRPDDSGLIAAYSRTSVWEAAPAATGAEIARALRRAGFETHLAGPEHVSLFRDGVEVTRLALHATVRAATLRAILRSFGVTAEELAEYLLNQTDRTDP